MKPSLSLIVFTVCAGAGYGLFMLSVALPWYANAPFSAAERNLSLLLALTLIVIGLGSSVFHLANKRNAWKAFIRFRSSWLSREAVFSVLFFPPALLYFAAPWFGVPTDAGWLRFTGLLALLLALATVFSTGMIYASLKTIRQWHSPLVPVNYLLLALASGGMLLSTLRALFSQQTGAVIALTLGLLGAALLVKLMYFHWIGRPAGPTLNTALALDRGRIRLLDVGHSHGTFLTDEFGHQLPRAIAWLLRGWVIAAVYLIPLLLLQWVTGQAAQTWVTAALLVMITGLFAERWLFLIEGRHVVNLYHGRQRT